MKRAMSILLTVVMLCSLMATGCNQNSDVMTRTFKIGGIGPLTGSNAFYGQEVLNGMELAANEINNEGGICGQHVEINFKDDAADPGKALEAYEELKEWGVHTIVGATTSDSCIALASETERDNVFQITPSSSAVESVNHYNAFQVCFADPNQGAAAAEYISENNLGSKIAVIYDTTSSYSSGIFRGFSDKAHEIGLEMVAIEGFSAENNEDFTVALKDIKESGADLVFLPIYYQQASIILRQASEMGVKAGFLGCDGIEGILEVEGFDSAYAEGMMYLTPFVAEEMSPEAHAFASKYETLYGSRPSQFAANAYDAVYIIKRAAEEAGVTIDMSAEKICEAMVGAMIVIRYQGITCAEDTYMTWDEIGMVNKEPKIAIIVDGEYKIM